MKARKLSKRYFVMILSHPLHPLSYFSWGKRKKEGGKRKERKGTHHERLERHQGGKRIKRVKIKSRRAGTVLR